MNVDGVDYICDLHLRGKVVKCAKNTVSKSGKPYYWIRVDVLRERDDGSIKTNKYQVKSWDEEMIKKLSPIKVGDVVELKCNPDITWPKTMDDEGTGRVQALTATAEEVL